MLLLGSGYSEVTCMDKDVGIWEGRLTMVGVVGVGNANDTDFVWMVFRLS